jgi:hypothetical protein
MRRRIAALVAASTFLAFAATAAAAAPVRAKGGLPAPSNVRATTVSASQISVTWSAVGGVNGYQVLRGPAPGGPFALVGTVPGSSLSFLDTGLAPATSYSYVVTAVAGNMVSSASAVATATTQMTPPANLKANAAPSSVALSWDAVPGAIRYDVLRTAPNGTGIVGTTVQTAFVDTTVTAGVLYTYAVRSVAANGATGDSMSLAVATGVPTTTTLAITPNPSEVGQTILLTAAVPAGAGGYVDFYGDGTFLGEATVDPIRKVADLDAVVAASGTFVFYAFFRGDPVSQVGSSSSQSISQVANPAYARVSFGAPSTHAVGSTPRSVAIADVTGDRLADVLVTTTTVFPQGNPAADWKLLVFAQQPDHTLAAPVRLATHAASGSGMLLATGDVDGDGRTDVVVGAESAGGVDVFLQGPGGLGSPILFPIGGAIYDMRLADVNRDGRADLVVSLSDHVAVYPALPGGTFGSPIVVGPGHGGQVEVADMNGDGLPDVVLREGTTITVFAQRADGTFAQQAQSTLPASGNPGMGAMAVGDVTGDGLADVVANVGGNSPDSRVHVFAQRSGQLAAPLTYPVYDLPAPGPMALADINGDGRRDLVIPHAGFARLGIMLQRPDGRLGAEQLFGIPDASNYDVRGLAVGDVNGDGRPDVVIANYNYGLVVLPQT